MDADAAASDFSGDSSPEDAGRYGSPGAGAVGDWVGVAADSGAVLSAIGGAAVEASSGGTDTPAGKSVYS